MPAPSSPALRAPECNCPGSLRERHEHSLGCPYRQYVEGWLAAAGQIHSYIDRSVFGGDPAARTFKQVIELMITDAKAALRSES